MVMAKLYSRGNQGVGKGGCNKENNGRLGLVKNLSNQINAFFDDWNVGNYRLNERNRQTNLRFAKYLGEHTNLRKIKNMETHYLYDYVDYMKKRLKKAVCEETQAGHI